MDPFMHFLGRKSGKSILAVLTFKGSFICVGSLVAVFGPLISKTSTTIATFKKASLQCVFSHVVTLKTNS